MIDLQVWTRSPGNMLPRLQMYMLLAEFQHDSSEQSGPSVSQTVPAFEECQNVIGSLHTATAAGFGKSFCDGGHATGDDERNDDGPSQVAPNRVTPSTLCMISWPCEVRKGVPPARQGPTQMLTNGKSSQCQCMQPSAGVCLDCQVHKYKGGILASNHLCNRELVCGWRLLQGGQLGSQGASLSGCGWAWRGACLAAFIMLLGKISLQSSRARHEHQVPQDKSAWSIHGHVVLQITRGSCRGEICHESRLCNSHADFNSDKIESLVKDGPQGACSPSINRGAKKLHESCMFITQGACMFASVLIINTLCPTLSMLLRSDVPKPKEGAVGLAEAGWWPKESTLPYSPAPGMPAALLR